MRRMGDGRKGSGRRRSGGTRWMKGKRMGFTAAHCAMSDCFGEHSMKKI